MDVVGLSLANNLKSIGEKWETKASMTYARKGLGACSFNDKVYVVGGVFDGVALKVHECYDTITDTWTTKADIPERVYYLTYTELNGLLYVIGGFNSGYKYYNQCYDPYTNTWSSKANMPSARCGHTASIANGNIYVLGGVNESAMNENEGYNPSINVWSKSKVNAVKSSEVTENFTLEYGQIYTLVNPFITDDVVNFTRVTTGDWNNYVTLNKEAGTFQVTGDVGAQGQPFSVTYIYYVESLMPCTDMPTVRQHMISATVNNKIYVIGGYSSTTTIFKNEMFDEVTNIWTSKADVPQKCVFSSAVAIGTDIFCIGGVNDEIYPTDMNLKYDTIINQWISMLNKPTPTQLLTSAVVNNKIYVIGGSHPVYSEINTNEEYSSYAEDLVIDNLDKLKSALSTGIPEISLTALNKLSSSGVIQGLGALKSWIISNT